MNVLLRRCQVLCGSIPSRLKQSIRQQGRIEFVTQNQADCRVFMQCDGQLLGNGLGVEVGVLFKLLVKVAYNPPDDLCSEVIKTASRLPLITLPRNLLLDEVDQLASECLSRGVRVLTQQKLGESRCQSCQCSSGKSHIFLLGHVKT